MPPSHPAPPSQERPAEPAPLSNASSSASPEEFAAIENEDDKQEMYVKVHTKKSAFQAFAASLEQRFTNLERTTIELQGHVASLRDENQTLHGLVASLQDENQKLHGLVASLGDSNQALGASNQALGASNQALWASNQELRGMVASLGASNRALQGRVDRLERALIASEQNAGLYLDVARFYATDADQGAGDLTNADE